MAAKDIRVGTRTDASTPPGVATGAHWVAIGDTVLDEEHALLSVDHHADNGFHHVTITLACRSYATVDVDVDERPEPPPSDIVFDQELLSPHHVT